MSGGALSPRKVLLVTDPGRDIDDVVTLVALAGSNFTFPGEPSRPDAFELVGVVTSGGAAVKRACVTRGWLRLLGISDEVPIAPCREVEGIGKLACFFPAGFPSPADAALYAAEDKGVDAATDLVVRLCERHGSDLALWCISPLTPLALMMSDLGGADGRGTAALRSIGTIFIQGQALIAGEGEEHGVAAGRLVPSAECFNLREDMASAHAVFAALQDFVPIRMLGKFAAYRVSLYKTDFNAFDEPVRAAGFLDASGASGAFDDESSDAAVAAAGAAAAESRAGGDAAHSIPSLLLSAKNNLNVFRCGNPALFYSIYPVPPSQQNDEEWFESIGAFLVLPPPRAAARALPLTPPSSSRLFRARWFPRLVRTFLFYFPLSVHLPDTPSPIETCCHPYDPLLCLSAMMPELFHAQAVPMGALAADGFGAEIPLESAAPGSGSGSGSAATPARVHTFIGNCKENNGVPSDASVGEMHDELSTRLQRASERMVAVATAARS